MMIQEVPGELMPAMVISPLHRWGDDSTIELTFLLLFGEKYLLLYLSLFQVIIPSFYFIMG
jgi:hypothetical protein